MSSTGQGPAQALTSTGKPYKVEQYTVPRIWEVRGLFSACTRMRTHTHAHTHAQFTSLSIAAMTRVIQALSHAISYHMSEPLPQSSRL
eukprot:scaffold40114_cov17-Tisochrysis_lutea.AAC.1